MTPDVEFSSKNQALLSLSEIYNKWNKFLSDLNDNQASTLSVHSNRTIKDDIGHLYMWQRVSVARIDAALKNSDPHFNFWPKEFDLEVDNDLVKINEWIYNSNLHKSWVEVYNSWSENFLLFISLCEKINEQILLQRSKFSWLQDYPLIAVLSGSYNHHREHFEKIENLRLN